MIEAMPSTRTRRRPPPERVQSDSETLFNIVALLNTCPLQGDIDTTEGIVEELRKSGRPVDPRRDGDYF